MIEKMVLDKPIDAGSSDGSFGLGLSTGQPQLSSIADSYVRSGIKPWQKLKPSIEILCNNQVSSEKLSRMGLQGFVFCSRTESHEFVNCKHETHWHLEATLF